MKNTVPFLLLILLYSCEDHSSTERNEWISDIMQEVYLWEEYIPEDINPESYDDSHVFFDRHIYDAEDKWSWLSDDYFETKDLYSGITTTAGHEFYLAYRSDNYHIIGVVEYVLPHSPAANNNIKRGDIFTRIDNTSLTSENYYQLLTGSSSYTIGFDTMVDQELIALKDIAITEDENFQENPIHIDSIYSIGGKQIGYLMYNGFMSSFNDEMTSVFSNFKSAAITDLILDLRYNSGGEVTAEEHLANLIAPKSAEGEIFSKHHWNQLYTDYFTSEYGEEYFYSRIENTPENINMTGKIYALVSGSTASASEGLLNGLNPLTEMTLVGDTTHGKYTGMWVIPDNDSAWAIIPIVVKSTNKNDESVRGGMAPNIVLTDNPLDGYQLGDIRETMLSKAIMEITGEASYKSKTMYQPIITGDKLGNFRDGRRIDAKPYIIGWGNHFFHKD